jgi:hypothetical protein
MQATRKVGNLNLKNTIPEIDKSIEIACIAKKIIPKSLRPSLLSSTLTSQIRRKQNLEDIRKKDIQTYQCEI